MMSRFCILFLTLLTGCQCNYGGNNDDLDSLTNRMSNLQTGDGQGEGEYGENQPDAYYGNYNPEDYNSQPDDEYLYQNPGDYGNHPDAENPYYNPGDYGNPQHDQGLGDEEQEAAPLLTDAERLEQIKLAVIARRTAYIEQGIISLATFMENIRREYAKYKESTLGEIYKEVRAIELIEDIQKEKTRLFNTAENLRTIEKEFDNVRKTVDREFVIRCIAASGVLRILTRELYAIFNELYDIYEAILEKHKESDADRLEDIYYKIQNINKEVRSRRTTLEKKIELRQKFDALQKEVEEIKERRAEYSKLEKAFLEKYKKEDAPSLEIFSQGTTSQETSSQETSSQGTSSQGASSSRRKDKGKKKLYED